METTKIVKYGEHLSNKKWTEWSNSTKTLVFILVIVEIIDIIRLKF